MFVKTAHMRGQVINRLLLENQNLSLYIEAECKCVKLVCGLWRVIQEPQ